MNKEEYIKIAKKEFKGNSRNIMIDQINNYFNNINYEFEKNIYKIGDIVTLKKGTLLHGTYNNLDSLKNIVANGLIAGLFLNQGRNSRYPSSVGVWKLDKDYKLNEYIDFYSGGTVNCYNIGIKKDNTFIIPYSQFNNFLPNFIKENYTVWKMEQTKEARFLPSLVQRSVQIGIIFNGNNKIINTLLKKDILNPSNINDKDVKPFVHESFYKDFIQGRKNKDAFFTDRESAILFGIPSCLIEGVLVGREYEKNKKILNEIKELLPNCFICNLDGVVIY